MDRSPNEGSDDVLDAVDTPYASIREAAETLMGAVERAGAPWEFVPSASLAGRDLLGSGSRTWPIVLPDGEVLGFVVRKAGGSMRHDELITVLLRTVSSLVSAEQASEEARRRAARAEREARIDSMTGLLNRRGWEDALAAEAARMRRHDHPATVVVVDIDQLKETNDVEGHLAGDLLIRRTAAAIRSAVRDEDVVARVGGDEFSVLAVDSSSSESVLDRVRSALADISVSASAGAAAAAPGTSLDEAFARADREMYADKRRRRADDHGR